MGEFFPLTGRQNLFFRVAIWLPTNSVKTPFKKYMRKHYSLSLLDCDNMQTYTHTCTSQKEGLAQKIADKKGNGGECKKQGNNRMKREGGSSGGLLSSSALSLWQENYSEVQALDGCLKRNSRESLNETDLLKQTVPYRWNQIAFTRTVGLRKTAIKVTCSVRYCHVSPFTQSKETICMTYHFIILFICFFIHCWDIFCQLSGFSWLCLQSCSLAESAISLEQISLGGRCITLGIPVSLKYCCF